MADALCGPSNPLQQFKQQSNHDRTLQQDRLVSRSSPAQGFRSLDPNAGLLDPEFEAFQAGVPLADYQSYLPHAYAPPPHQRGQSGPSQTPSWAADFQQMHISPSPLHQQQPHHAAANTNGWAQGFRQHITQSAPRAQQASPLAFQQRARYGYSGFQSNLTPQAAFQSPAQQSNGKQPAYDTFDEAAFEQAFDQARDDVMAEMDTKAEQDQFRSLNVDQQRRAVDDILREAGVESRQGDLADTGAVLKGQQDHFRSLGIDQQRDFVDNALREAGVRTQQSGLADTADILKEQQDQFRSMNIEQQRTFIDDVLRGAGVASQQGRQLVDSDAMIKDQQDHFRALDAELQKNIVDDLIDHALERQQPINQQEDVTAEQNTRQEEDDLAATAHELLEKVSNNNTDKFRNSQFLDLMRKLRDREVKVEGDKMVETTTATNSTLTPASATTTALFDNSEQRPSPLVPAPFALPPQQRVVDTRPLDYGTDAVDTSRIDPRDGQDVVDLLSQPAGAGAGDEIGTSAPSAWKGAAPFYGDLRSLHGARSEESGSMSEVLYGEDGTLVGVVPGGRRQGGGFARFGGGLDFNGARS
ncbi:hypothetical protein LTR86_005676 [Recurvomyces mirabilis]|nr:hypothetical protein LTR86_005676 [Recurvomyces mirabilis]